MNHKQLEINEACREYYEAMVEHDKMPDNKPSPWKRLSSYSAEVLETPSFFILRAYNTVFAVVDKDTGRTWDVLIFQRLRQRKRYTWREIPRR